MRSIGKRLLAALLLCLASSAADSAQTPNGQPAPDLSKQPTLYLVGYAHLDTQWRWEYPQVINEFLPKTMHDNFALFEKYPNYTFNFTGGAPREFSVKVVDAMVGKKMTVLPPPPPAIPSISQAGPLVRVGDGPVHVVSANAD